MIQQVNFDKYIFTDGKIIYVTFDCICKAIEMKLQIRKKVEKQIIPCLIRLRLENVTELDIFESFDTLGYYSDFIFVKQPDTKYYISFDPFDNSGEPNKNDNFIIKASSYNIDEI